MYVQIASTDIYMATQNCIQNRASLQNYLLNLSVSYDYGETYEPFKKNFENIFGR